MQAHAMTVGRPDDDHGTAALSRKRLVSFWERGERELSLMQFLTGNSATAWTECSRETHILPFTA
jgi:hypothetical protein